VSEVVRERKRRQQDQRPTIRFARRPEGALWSVLRVSASHKRSRFSTCRYSRWRASGDPRKGLDRRRLWPWIWTMQPTLGLRPIPIKPDVYPLPERQVKSVQPSW